MRRRRRGDAAVQHLRQIGGGVFRQRAQIGIERHDDAALCLGIEQRTLWDRTAGHFLKTQRLRAKLHLVGAVQLGLAALVFDGKGGLSVRTGNELDQIGSAGQVQPPTGQRQGQNPPHPARLAGSALVSHRVQHVALGGKAVLGPEPFQMDQRGLPQAINRMLQRREGNGLLGAGHCQRSSRISTPSGRSSRSMLTL